MPRDPKDHPVATGLIALLGVGLVVGILVSGGALAATRVLGLTGGNSEAGSTSQQSMYVPRPSPTVRVSGATVTLAPGQTASSAATSLAPVVPMITLSAAQAQVGSYQRIDLTGIYQSGEGHIVQVQRLENNQWVDFSTVDAEVSGATFATYVQTSRTGVNSFRVRDTDSDLVSNQVDVTVG